MLGDYCLGTGRTRLVDFKTLPLPSCMHSIVSLLILKTELTFSPVGLNVNVPLDAHDGSIMRGLQL